MTALPVARVRGFAEPLLARAAMRALIGAASRMRVGGWR